MRIFVLLTAMWLFFGGATLLWLRLDQAPPSWDDAWYLANSLTQYDALADGGILGYARQFLASLGFKAPLIVALPTPFYLLLGRNWHVAYLVNVVAMLVLFLAVYAIGRKVANRRTGLIATYITATMPLLYGLVNWYLVEYTLTAVVAVAIGLLLVSENLESIPAAAAFGVTCAIGLLLKASFPLFVAIPFLFSIRRCRSKGRALMLLAIPCLILALPWYAIHWRATLQNAIAAGYSELTTSAQGTGEIFSFSGITGYLAIVVRDGMSPAYAVLALVLVIVAVWRGQFDALRGLTIVGLWLAPILIFVFAGNKDLRYGAPLYPALAVGLAILLDSAIGARTWIAVVLLAAPFLLMTSTLFGLPFPGEPHRYARRYERKQWPQDQILDVIAANISVKPGEHPALLLATDRSWFNANNFELAVKQRRLPLLIDSTAYERDLNRVLASADAAAFVVLKEGGEPESPYFNIHAARLVEHLRHSPIAEEIPSHAKLPDGGTAHIFRNVRPRAFLKSELTKLPGFHAAFGGFIELTGLSVEKTSEVLQVKYGWRTIQPVDREYWCFTHIVDSDNKTIGFLDHRLLGGDPPITTWKAGDTAYETLRFTLPTQAAGQPLRLRIGLYHVPSGQRLRVELPAAAEASLIQDNTAFEINAAIREESAVSPDASRHHAPPPR